MKKRNLKSFNLNKTSISNFKQTELVGGISGKSCDYSTCGVHADTVACHDLTLSWTAFCETFSNC